MSYLKTMQAHEKNLNYLDSMDASESDIKEYMDKHGLTMAKLRQYESVKQSLAKGGPMPDPLERLGRGATDVAMGIGQLTGQEANVKRGLTYLPGGMPAGSLSDVDDQALIDMERDENKRYEANFGPGQDWWRIAGQAGAQSPMGLLAMAPTGLIARTLLGAGLGGTGGAMIYADDPGERLTNFGYGLGGGALFSAAAPPVARMAASVGRGIRNGVVVARNMMRRLPGITQKYQRAISESLGNVADDINGSDIASYSELSWPHPCQLSPARQSRIAHHYNPAHHFTEEAVLAGTLAYTQKIQLLYANQRRGVPAALLVRRGSAADHTVGTSDCQRPVHPDEKATSRDHPRQSSATRTAT